MESFKELLDRLLQLLLQFSEVVTAALIAVEIWLRAQLSQLGVSPMLQTAILLAVAVLLLIAGLRMFGGLIRVAVVLILLLIALHVLLPVIQH